MTRRVTAYYTPENVAQSLANKITLRRPAIVIDPACGDGQLLAAVIRQHGTAGLTFVGVDTSRRALAKCRKRLKESGAPSVRLHHGDFLDLASTLIRRRAVRTYVVMNPPFISYKHLNLRRRARLRSRVPSLTGRFNLADAFVLKSVAQLKPDGMVSILPASTGARLSTNGHLLGSKAWQRLPDTTFSAMISTGFMLWRPPIQLNHCNVSEASRDRRKQRAVKSDQQSIVLVRNGAATGADAIFLKIAAARSKDRGGVIVRCVRGREVARAKNIAELPKIWLPTKGSADAKGCLTRRELLTLQQRHCVRQNGKPLFSYHSPMPDWFLGKRKLIVPEICQKLTVLDDRKGRVLPLHSTLAIMARSIRVHQAIKKILREPKTWIALRRKSEKMVGGAIRLTAPSLAAAIRKGLQKSALWVK